MRIIVGISGGVDSAVAALILKRQGHDVSGLFMKNWEDDDRDGYCASEEDYRAARSVCDALAIPLHLVNFSDEYRERVFSLFLAAHRAGLTPNPDVLCNREIKFSSFLDHALALGAERVATGHYARLGVNRESGLIELRKAGDLQKDQSYFLSLLGQKQLAHALFPIGTLHKPEVRRIARDSALPNHDRRDSTGICFIGERNFRTFLGRYLQPEPGEIRDVDGRIKGTHPGVMYYTLGQRRGLGIGGPGGPWYIVEKRLTERVLVVAPENHPRLFSSSLLARDVAWVAGVSPDLPLRCTAKIRYRQQDEWCRVEAAGTGGIRVSFDRPQRAVTPGQSLALYLDDLCLGGGTIVEASVPDQEPDAFPQLG
ncbi:MAG: tRNA 2-thiouridine(34) synthase MnmA [Acidiferrobacteraceae bacterium]